MPPAPPQPPALQPPPTRTDPLPRAGFLDRAASWPWWVAPLATFLLSRVVGTALLIATWTQQEPDAIDDLLSRWDADWYLEIAAQGYPSQLPRDDEGDVQQNVWAFYPAFPLLARLAGLTGIPLPLAASLASLVVGASAMVLLHHLLASTVDRFAGLATVAVLSFAPAALCFSVPYSESLALLFAVLAVTFAHENRPRAFVVTAFALALTRPVTLPLAVVAAAVGWNQRRLLAHHQDSEPSAVAPRRWAAAAALAVAAFGLWPAVAALATGEPSAYLLTQQAWHTEEGPRTTWITALYTDPRYAVITVTVLLMYTAGAWRASSKWPLALRTWAVAYPVYVLAASATNSSLARMLMVSMVMLWPVSAIADRCTNRASQALFLGGTVLLGATLQFLWISGHWQGGPVPHP